MQKQTDAGKTLEQIVAATILQTTTTGSVIDIDGQKYTIADPTPATLIMVSAEVSRMPKINAATDNILFEVLRTAKDMQPIGRVAAILILGAKRIKENRLIVLSRQVKKWSWKKFRRVETWEPVCTRKEIDWLAERILESLSPQTISNLITKRLAEMQVGDFFGITTSLSAINILKATKEVETAPGE